mmetsp:Transcript_114344/g.328487  ORF Transcript_114344/g.328487 Transcript_114344/m.328487 type:complete len:826 (+) Transcript_114344:152-2629(+)|eukprot:CAMPEP_0170214446 /NCGR_PEP_ID=MMETSP0116_2-20130129/6854_1 /TAXON_ID=400756 /ORGANISM="Durinskia baltica, Strain CSIRO CS-38" /LENGTH=825 /DNA_ID=CAMNT_0010465011 /DNA_START=147 /DNA_END=2624 /DNA_ORIENTATION=+
MAKHDDQQSPLGFLDRLLDDERDSNLHLGDLRFWKHYEHIRTPQVYRTTSLEYRNMKLMFCEAVLYTLFLIILTSFIVMHRSGSIYESRRQQLDYWGGCTRTIDGRTCTVDQVRSQEALMTWLREDFAPKAFTEHDMLLPIASSVSLFRLQSGSVAWTPRYVGDTKTSVLVGAVRIRQLRVQYNQDCSIVDDFRDIHKDCFGKYSPGVESKLPWHPEWTPMHLQAHYKWYDSSQTEQGDTAGFHGTYPGSGFVLDLPLNLTGAQTRLKELEDWAWLDQRTRAVIIEVNTLNPNVNIFVNTKFVFEFPATGGVYIKYDATSFRSIAMSFAVAATDDSGGEFITLVAVTALFFLLLAYTIFLIVKNGSRFFTYFWAVMDLIILALYFVVCCMFLARASEFDDEPNMQPEVLADPEMFFPIGKFAPQFELSNQILACLGVAAWLKVLKYFTLAELFAGYVRVIERCIVNLLLFSALLFLVLFGFAVALHLGYGADDNYFGSIWGSLVAVIVAPASGVELAPIFVSGDLLGPLLIFTYIVLVFLLLLNIFMAICVETYSVCTYELNEVKAVNKANPMLVFIWTYLNAVRGVKLVGKETEEDRGTPAEQQIALSALPEAIQMRYMEERRKMNDIVSNALAAIEDAKRRRNEPELYNTSMTGEEEDDGDDVVPPTPLHDLRPQPPEEENVHMMLVHRVQLQRMLEDHPVIQEICGTRKAVEVIRRFQVDSAGGDPYDMVAKLQESIAKKLHELEEQGMDLTFDEMEALKAVSQELHSALTESQREWRAELLSVLQMASLLSKALIDLTNQLAKVQINHDRLTTGGGADLRS